MAKYKKNTIHFSLILCPRKKIYQINYINKGISSLEVKTFSRNFQVRSHINEMSTKFKAFQHMTK